MTSMKKYIIAFQAMAATQHNNLRSHWGAAPTRVTNIASGYMCPSNRRNFRPISNAKRICGRRNNLLDKRSRIKVLLKSKGGDDDENQPYSKRQARKRDPIMNNIIKDTNIVLSLLESASRFLFWRLPLPSILSLLPGRLGGQNKIEVPLIYILSIMLSAAVVPIITWGLVVAFFGLYFALGMAFMKEYDDLDNDFDESYNKNNQLDIHRQESEYNGIIPLAAFTGALASAALLSPQGFVLPNASFSLISPVAVISLVLGGLAILMGICDTQDDELRLQEKDARERVIREERRKMNLWDDEIKRTSDRKQRNDDQ